MPGTKFFPLRVVFLLFAVIVTAMCSAPTEVLPGWETPQAEAGDSVVPERGFISSRPAETWEHGLLVGNGTIGASILGQVPDETIVFSHERLFLPERPPLLPPPTGERLFEIRRLIDLGLYRQAGQLAFDMSVQKGFMYPDPLMPAFELDLRMETQGEIRDYLRSVDFRTGEAVVRWADGKGEFRRAMFVSRADGAAVMRISGPAPGSVNCRLEFKPRDPGHKRFQANIGGVETGADETFLTYTADFLNAYPASIKGCRGAARVVARGGSTKAEGRALAVSGADEVLIFIDIDLPRDPAAASLEHLKESLARIPENYDVLLERHTRLHGEIFGRMRLDLGGRSEHSRTSEDLIAQAREDRPSKTLIEKVFDAGRYNILSSTGELPPTLQGIWAGTYEPPWASDFTHNGNVPSAIASMLQGNMPELMRAYTSYIESLVPYLEVNARRIFGARGIVLPSRSTTDGYNNSFNADFPGQFWVAGAAWAAHFFYDYYLFTGDKEFLERHALPFMEKAALFFEDYLYEGPDGIYVFSPTQSPENAPSNTKHQVSFNATMDVAAARELLHNAIAASLELGVNREKIFRWRDMLEKLPEYMINEDGAVREWLTPVLEDNYNHRHSSQLYALFDGMPEEIARDPELQAAFKRLIELKLDRHWTDNKRGFMSFGLVQLGQAAASLGDRDLAYRSLEPLVKRYWYHNLASTHDDDALFNMDISGGLPAVIIMMLAISEPGKIRLLPALPEGWPSGTIEGMLCRGGVELRSLNWDEGVIRLTLVSTKKQDILLRAPADVKRAVVTQGRVRIRKGDDNRSRRVTLAAGEEVSIEIRF